jgi:hypothetical protein
MTPSLPVSNVEGFRDCGTLATQFIRNYAHQPLLCIRGGEARGIATVDSVLGSLSSEGCARAILRLGRGREEDLSPATEQASYVTTSVIALDAAPSYLLCKFCLHAAPSHYFYATAASGEGRAVAILRLGGGREEDLSPARTATKEQ